MVPSTMFPQRRRQAGPRLRAGKKPWKRALAVGLALGAVGACYRGGDLDEKEPPPGEIGGACIEGLCNAGMCVHGQICYDPQDPCKGIYCGGNGTCFQDLDNLNTPVCVCDAGYQNETYAYFCTPG